MAEALTLTDAGYLSNDLLVRGIVLNVANFDPVLGGVNDAGGVPRALPFVTINNKQYTWNRENARGSASWQQPNAVLTGEAATFSTTNVTPKYIYRQVEVPLPYQIGYGDTEDQEAQQLLEASRGITDAFMSAFYYGDSAVNADEPNGVHMSFDSNDGQIIAENGASATAAALQMDSLDQLRTDIMKLGVDMFVTTRAVHRRLAAALRTIAIGGITQNVVDGFGRRVDTYDGVPLLVSDYLTDTELCDATYGKYNRLSTGKAGGSATSVLALKFGVDTLHAVQQTPGMQVDYWPRLEDKDNSQYRIKWYVIPVVRKSKFGIGAINNIASGSAVTA